MAEAVTLPNSNVSIMFKPEGTGADEQSVVRRTGNYHPNVWENDFIQSLSSPYGASWYRERVETLIKEIKVDAFNSLFLLLLEDPAAQITPSAYALVESFSIVDVVQRLGIDCYFETEIKTVLDYAYKHWNEGGISWGSENADFDLYTTALGFRILRLNGYHVSPDVFDNFQNENGQFVYPQPTKEGDSFRQLRNMLSLYRAAEISFPGEKKMKEAKSFASAYLQEALVQSQELSEETQLLAEVQYFVKYPWRCRVPRWEAWNSIQIFRNDINAWMSIDGVYKVCYAKLGTLITIIDDIFDTYGTIDELIPFKTALINWDMSMMDLLPNYMQISLQFAHKTYMERAFEAEKIHGPRVQKWMQDYWTTLIFAEFKDAEWIANDYHPTLSEYLKNAVISSTVPVVTLFPMILIDTFLPDDIMERVNRFESHVAWGCRLIDDSKDFKGEQEHGDNASWIECYVRDNHGTTRTQALDHMNMLIELNTKELNMEHMFYRNDIPICCKRLYFDSMYRSVAFIWRDESGFSISNRGTKDDIMKILIEPIPF